MVVDEDDENIRFGGDIEGFIYLISHALSLPLVYMFLFL